MLAAIAFSVGNVTNKPAKQHERRSRYQLSEAQETWTLSPSPPQSLPLWIGASIGCPTDSLYLESNAIKSGLSNTLGICGWLGSANQACPRPAPKNVPDRAIAGYAKRPIENTEETACPWAL